MDEELPQVRLPSGLVLTGEPGQDAVQILTPYVRAAIASGRCPWHGEWLDDTFYCEVCRAMWLVEDDGSWVFVPDIDGLVERARIDERAAATRPPPRSGPVPAPSAPAARMPRTAQPDGH